MQGLLRTELKTITHCKKVSIKVLQEIVSVTTKTEQKKKLKELGYKINIHTNANRLKLTCVTSKLICVELCPAGISTVLLTAM